MFQSRLYYLNLNITLVVKKSNILVAYTAQTICGNVLPSTNENKYKPETQ